jgi:hypothetical protein
MQRSLDTLKWTEIQAKGSQPTKRYGHTAVVYQGAMYVFGGYDAFGLACNDLWHFNFGALPCRHSLLLCRPSLASVYAVTAAFARGIAWRLRSRCACSG